MPCGCFEGLFGRSKKHGALAPDIGERRWSPQAPKMSVDEVFAMVRPRASPPVKPLDLAQSWATPIPNGKVARKVTFEVSGLEAVEPPTGHNFFDIDRKTVSKLQVEQLGFTPSSLPPPLQPHERERIIRQVLPTATHQMLSRLPPDVIRASGREGQTLRRRLVNGATVVWFTAGYPGKRFVFERAAALGVRSVIIDHPDSWAKDLVAQGVIAKFLPVDMGQPAEDVVNQSLELIKGLGQDGLTGEADGIVTLVELSVSLVARLCEQLGLPGPSPHAVAQARDKHATRAALAAAGLATPKNFLIENDSMLMQAADHVGFPAVLKPVSGAASLGVKKVANRSEMTSCYAEVIKELQSLVVISGALVQDSGSGKGIAASKVVNIAVLCEQYLDGQEVDVDIVLSEGEWTYAAITDNGPTIEPYFNETWGNCPSKLPLEQQRELKQFGVAATKALGFTDGVFHVECKYTSTGPQLIEVNARMGGGPVHEHNLRVWGVDLVEEAIFIGLGIPSRPDVPKVPLEPVAYYLKTATLSGIVGQMPDFAELSKRDGVIWAKPMVKVGDKVCGPKDDMPTWTVDIMVKAPTVEEAIALAFKMEADAVVKLR